MTGYSYCRWCEGKFIPRAPKKRKGQPAPPLAEICGRPACRAWETWGPEEWSGHARMATARRAAGVPLDALDIEALTRATPSTHDHPDLLAAA